MIHQLNKTPLVLLVLIYCSSCVQSKTINPEASGSQQPSLQFTRTIVVPTQTKSITATLTVPPDPKKSVELEIEHGVLSPVGGPSFGVKVFGWVPNGDVVVFLVGPQGEEIAIIPMENSVKATSEGETSFLIPYEFEGVYPALWMVVIAGSSGGHAIEVKIPKVIHPSDDNGDYIIDFNAAETPYP